MMFMLSIDIQITFETPVHIGATGNREAVARDLRGRPCIRASTLRGAHRAATEQAAAALGLSVCKAPIAHRMCQPISGEPFCAVCRIFGSPWLPGKIYHRELITTEAPQIEAQTRVSRSRRRGVRLTAYDDRREVLPAGTTFAGQIDHLLGDEASLGLALAGLRSIHAMGSGN